MGYHRAGFEVVGVDIAPQPHYPFEFIQEPYEAALFDLMNNWPEGTFDAIHASPPCQAHSSAGLAATVTYGKHYEDLLTPTRPLLIATGLPWVIENVPGAPMRADFWLCGCGFGLPDLKRERWFETSWHGGPTELRPPCNHDGNTITVTGHTPQRWAHGRRKGVTKAEREAAMGIDWMTVKELSQAIPPAYTEFIGAQLLDQLTNQRRPDMARINAHSTTAPRLGAYRDCDATDGGSE
jgi:DNA (cytosine-5)-methyltransferase 1